MGELPLRGRTFLVAASEDLVDKLAQAVRERGGQAIPFPTIRIIPPADSADLDRGIRMWPVLDWVVFTSAHGVEAVVERAKALGVDLSRFRGSVATVGPATQTAAEAAGLPVSVVPDEFLTDAIAGALGDLRGQTVLLPRSRLARKGLEDEIRSRGATVIEADAYDAVPAAPDTRLVREAPRIDLVLFTSASAANHLMRLLPPDLLDRLIREADAACIGPVTAEAARSLGFRVSAVARVHTVPGLVETLAEVRADG